MTPNELEDSFAKSLQQLTPGVPETVKAKLLYECGVASAKASMQKNKLRNRVGMGLALMVAASFGAIANQQLAEQPSQPVLAITSQPEPNIQQHILLARSSNTLSAATPLDQVKRLLDRTELSSTQDRASDPISNLPNSRPFGTLSYPSALN